MVTASRSVQHAKDCADFKKEKQSDWTSLWYRSRRSRVRDGQRRVELPRSEFRAQRGWSVGTYVVLKALKGEFHHKKGVPQ